MLMLLAKGCAKAKLWPPFILSARLQLQSTVTQLVTLNRKALFTLTCLLGATAVNADDNAYSQLHNSPIDVFSPAWLAGPKLSFELTDQNGLPLAEALLQQSKMRITVRGMLAYVELEQQFYNPINDVVNGVYQFPLPNDASVFAMTMMLGDRVITGRIDEKQQAKRNYEKAQQAGHKAALVSQQRPNVFSTQVANIEGQQSVSVKLNYQFQLGLMRSLDDDGFSGFSLRFPTLVAPRYHSVATNTVLSSQMLGAQAVPSDFLPQLISHKQQQIDTSIDVDLGLPLEDFASNVGELAVTQLASTHYRVEPTSALIANGDFELSFRAKEHSGNQLRLFKQTLVDDTYYMLAFFPPSEQYLAHDLARELVFVIDTSGSMQGESIAQAKQALLNALRRLTPHDSFNIIEFNSDVKVFSPLPLAATYSNLQRAEHYVAGLIADGGTEIAKALNAALDGQSDAARVRQVVFLTDGSIGNEGALFSLINGRLGDSKLFTVGIGATPNSYFMNQAAIIGRGDYLYIDDVAQVNDKIDALMSQLNAPALANIHVLNGVGMPLSDALPLADLYYAKPLLAYFTKQQLGASSQAVQIVADDVSGRTIEMINLADAIEAEGISREYAKQQMNALHPIRDKQQLTQLALKHQILSPYTSFIALEEYYGPVATATTMPASMAARGMRSLPQTGGYSIFWALLGSVFVVAGLMIFLTGQRYEKAN